MRTLGTLILLSVAALAQAPTAVQNPTAPATVSVQPTKTVTAGKPSPNGAKASGTITTPKVKPAVSVKVVPAAKPATSTQKAVSVKPAASTAKAASVATSGKPAVTDPKANTISARTKSASAAPAAKAVSASAAPKAVRIAKSAPTVGVLVKPAAIAAAKATPQSNSVSIKAGKLGAKPAIEQAKPSTVKVAVKPVARVKAGTTHTKAAMATVVPKPAASVQEGKPAEDKKASEEVRAAGWRDPFVSPVVAMGATGSGCSAGKRCLTIDQIALKGVVKSESGMIAVVTNALDKAYFLRENDPVFNGYVVKITGDSIIFKETFHDRLGKALTRDVTKSITRPVA